MNMEALLENYLTHLSNQERSAATIRQYRRDIACFLMWIGDRDFTRDDVLLYKKALENKCRPVSVNTKLSALNSFFTYLGQDQLRIKLLKIQRSPFCPAARELEKEDYRKLLTAARQKGDHRLYLLLQTICGTGIRVSELPYITAESVQKGQAVIQLKGKARTILLPKKLQQKLKTYLREKRITSGPVFVSRSGRPLDRNRIWKMMKDLCGAAGVSQGKVFPHNLRHLFARCFYAIDKDIVRLADILGHSSVNTTRIYIISTGEEHRRRLDALGLVI